MAVRRAGWHRLEEVTSMKELRKKERRHDFDSAQRFPFVGRSGQIVLQDRRSMPDRRLNNIDLKVVVRRQAYRHCLATMADTAKQ